ncbi:GLPGLI family protein [Chryseobacterium cucumeris]
MKILFSICFSLLCSFGFAQNSVENNTQKGNLINSVFYEELPITNLDDLKDIPKQYQEMIKTSKQIPKYYELLFNGSEALYKKEEKKRENPEDLNTGNMQMKETVIKFGGIAEMYKNFKTKTSVSSRTILDKEFLVSENLQKINWELINETKTMGSIDCRKAQAKIGGDLIEAWYAPGIPTMAGPSIYWGLPGLIVEVRNKTQHYLAIQIKENIAGTITIPTKGEKINPQEFQKKVIQHAEDYKKTMPPMTFGRN